MISFVLISADDLQFYVFFNTISVISGQWVVDNESSILGLSEPEKCYLDLSYKQSQNI